MSRSIRKGPYVDKNLFNKILKLNEADEKKVVNDIDFDTVVQVRHAADRSSRSRPPVACRACAGAKLKRAGRSAPTPSPSSSSSSSSPSSSSAGRAAPA